MYEGFAFGALWKLMGWLPAFLLRWWFSKDQLKSRIKMDVRNRPYAMQINGADTSDLTVWFSIHNNGYFSVEVDRVTVSVSIGRTYEFYDLDRVVLAPDATREMHVSGILSPATIALYKLNKNNGIVNVVIRAEFNSKIHNLSAKTDYISGFAINAINV